MKFVALLAGTIIVLAAGFRLLFFGLQDLTSARPTVGLALLAYAAGVICLVAGLIAGVLVLKPHYNI